jgi:hypothetical protein
LVEDLDDEIAVLESAMSDEEIKLIEQEMPVTKANKLRRKVIDYQDYLKKVSMRKRIDELVKLAKKRASISDKY